MRFSDSHHFRKTVAGCCMVLAPVFGLAGSIVSPKISTDAATQMRYFADHPDRTLITALCFLTAITLVIGATLGMMHILRERMAAYGHVGGGLALLGMVAAVAQMGAFLMAWQMVTDGVQPADVAAWDGITHATATVIIFAVFGAIVGTIGFIVLAAGLYRAKAVDWWMSALLALGVIGINISTPLESVAVGIAGSALLLVGLGSIGLMVLRETDAEWEHTPEYSGFSAAMHTG